MAGDSELTSAFHTVTYGENKHARNDSLISNIIEIRQDREELDLLNDIKSGLRPSNGAGKSLPTLLLYDEAGLKLFEDITYLDEYYLTNAEIEVLKANAASIAERIEPNSIVLELGSGNLRKIKILLDAFEAAAKPVEYYALDVSLEELRRTLELVPSGTFKHVRCYGLHGTYDDGFEWLKSKSVASRPKTVLSMGSSIGNFSRADAPGFLSSISKALRPGDNLLIGIDGCINPEKVLLAYNDPDGVTHRFIKNGLLHANQLLGSEQFRPEEWVVVDEYKDHGHVAHVSPLQDVVIDGVKIRANEHVFIEQSLKYDDVERAKLWEDAGLVEGASWLNSDASYGLHMAYKADFRFSLKPEQYAAGPVPSLAEWQSLWAVWDAVTQEMIPKEELLEKPIKLRNACIFYLGHIPTFLAIHLQKAAGKGPEGLAEYQKIFERGIDPDVDNPELCHDHSEIPDVWPPENEILAFQGRVRGQVREHYLAKHNETEHAIRKALWIGFEHELMHLETLLYMLVQSEKTLPPPNSVRPDFAAMAKAAASKAVPNSWIKVPSRTVSLGLDDVDEDEITRRYFGWDNEKPRRSAHVPSFSAQARAITNGEYAQYLGAIGSSKLPMSWTEMQPLHNGTNGHANGLSNGVTNGHIKCHATLERTAVRTVFGPVPLTFALDWPVMASYDELAAYATWAGGRIPTMEEVKSIYEYAEERKTKEVENALGKTIPAVNGHLINDGVEETPPQDHSVNGARGTVDRPNPDELFVNLEGANVGFKHWHPTPVTAHGNQLTGHSEMGGVWEWTSTVLEKHDGFVPMELYPGYTADFFDTKHNIVLGGSWATHPRIAGRKSFVNWYQRNYPYVWAGARLVQDM